MMMPPNASNAPPPPPGAGGPPPPGPDDGSGQGPPMLSPQDMQTLATGISPEACDVLRQIAPDLAPLLDQISQGGQAEGTDDGDGSIAPPRPAGASSGRRPPFAPGRPAQPTSRLANIQG